MKDKSIVFSVFFQAVLVSVLSIILMIINRIYGEAGDEWLIASGSLGIFSLVNIFFARKSPKVNFYISISFLIWTILFFDLLFDAWLISSVSLRIYDPGLKYFILALGFHILLNFVLFIIKKRRE
jgi:hypothetical protein